MTRLRIDVFMWGNNTTVYTDRDDGGGTRIAGPKMLPGAGKLVAQFYLDQNAVEAIAEDIAAADEESTDA